MGIFTVEAIERELRAAKKIAITGHIRPDGDCIGSCTALYQYLILNKNELSLSQIDVYLEPHGKEFNILTGTDIIRHPLDYNETYDVCILLDSSSLDRIGDSIKYFKSAKRTICIDHHITNDNFADINHVEANASSTCEVLYNLLNKKLITQEIAKSLYVGIVHDTGIFRHSSTSGKTMEIAADLISKGIDFTQLIEETFIQRTYTQLQILGRCLMDSRLFLAGKIVFSCISLKTLESYNASFTDLDSIIDQLRTVKGCEVAIFIYELDTNEYKISLRSNGIVDVSKIAHIFGGGGHVKAAGCTINGSVDDVVNSLTPYIEQELSDKRS